MLADRSKQRRSRAAPRDPERTRERLLQAASREIYRSGFQSAGLNTILASAGVTKGALYYHFKSKEALGYAVVEEVIAPDVHGKWVRPLQSVKDPIDALIGAAQRIPVRPEDVRGGCQLNNLAQEMSPLDAGFRRRLAIIFDAWRAAANEYVAGQFLWTGTDYLGESRQYPARGSTSGLLDLCGFRKAASYLREALWGERPMVYAAAREARPQSGPQTDFDTGARLGRLAEHWNWSADSRKTIAVEVYTNCNAAVPTRSSRAFSIPSSAGCSRCSFFKFPFAVSFAVGDMSSFASMRSCPR